MHPGFYLREFGEEDLSSLYRLIQSTIDVSYHGIYPPEAVAFFKGYHSEGDIASDAANGYTVVAERGGEVLGTGTLLGTNVRRMFIRPQHQRQGIGRAIAGELEEKARRDRAATMDLEASLGSRQFWESLGFVVSREDFIPVGNGQKLYFYRMAKILVYSQ